MYDKENNPKICKAHQEIIKDSKWFSNIISNSKDPII